LLVVCLDQEPSSLFLYDALGPEARTVLQALYDGPFDVLQYSYQPVILDTLPTPGNGRARFEPITVSEGSVYFNPETLLPDTLTQGNPYTPSGCTGPDCVQAYQGGDVSMDRWVVDFRLRAGVSWADGQPLTAQDSVFSFNLNAQAPPSTSKDLVYRTAGYEAVDTETVKWTGIPGYFDLELGAHFWSPLPEHALAGIAPEDLPTAEESAVSPMGWGAYRIKSRVPGASILLERSPSYFRASEGLPAFDEVLFRFVGDDPETVIQQLLTGECDILDESTLDEEAWPLLLDQEAQNRAGVVSTPGPRLLRADFLMNPADAEGPSIFDDPATRRALAGCVDRTGWIEDDLGGHGAVPATYLPVGHPLADPNASAVPYNPASAAAALESAGWLDEDGSPSTPRLARGVTDIPDGTPLAWTLGVSAGGWDELAARGVVDGMETCGAQVDLETLPPEELFATYPDGPAFGGRLGMVVWSWFGWVTPACDLFASWEIPSAERPEGSNASGFSDPAYDAACRAVLYGIGTEGGVAQAARETQRIFLDQMPAIPLATLPRAAGVGPGVCGLEADPSASSLLWDLESLTPCPP
jgi:peptide/nickel transport system substrate-binding protein